MTSILMTTHLQVHRVNNLWGGLEARDPGQNGTSNSSHDQIKKNMERQQHPNKFQSKTDASCGHLNLPLCMRVLDIDSRAGEKDRSYGDAMLQEAPLHHLPRSGNERQRSQNDKRSHRPIWRTPVHCQETQTEMVWPRDEVNRPVENHTAGDSWRNQKARRTENKMGRRHHQIDRAGPRRDHETDQGPTSMDPAVRDVYRGAPTIV